MPLRALPLLLAALMPGFAMAATTVRLPATACRANDVLLADGFEDATSGGGAPSEPSLGSGGVPGDSSGTVTVPAYPSGTYYLHVPPAYDPSRPAPVLVALHGAGGSHAAALTGAQTIRNDWRATADAGGFIVVAPVSTAASGGWIAPSSAADSPTDYDLIAAALAQVESSYNIERTRIYGWGYSAGGHVMHDLAINPFNATLNAQTLAAYAVNPGVLAALACSGLDDAQCAALLLQTSRRVPLDIHVGITDSLVIYARSDRDLMTANGWTLDGDLFYAEHSGGHVYTTANLVEIWNNVCTFAVTHP